MNPFFQQRLAGLMAEPAHPEAAVDRRTHKARIIEADGTVSYIEGDMEFILGNTPTDGECELIEGDDRDIRVIAQDEADPELQEFMRPPTTRLEVCPTSDHEDPATPNRRVKWRQQYGPPTPLKELTPERAARIAEREARRAEKRCQRMAERKAKREAKNGPQAD